MNRGASSLRTLREAYRYRIAPAYIVGSPWLMTRFSLRPRRRDQEVDVDSITTIRRPRPCRSLRQRYGSAAEGD